MFTIAQIGMPDNHKYEARVKIKKELRVNQFTRKADAAEWAAATEKEMHDRYFGEVVPASVLKKIMERHNLSDRQIATIVELHVTRVQQCLKKGINQKYVDKINAYLSVKTEKEVEKTKAAARKLMAQRSYSKACMAKTHRRTTEHDIRMISAKLDTYPDDVRGDLVGALERMRKYLE